MSETQSQVIPAVGMPPEEQKAILELYDRLERIDHYALLGVAATDDIKTIKRAYFQKAKEHHPDRWFRKDVGALKPKIDAIFAALAKAEATLGNATERAAYDAYLSARLKTRMHRRQASALEAAKEWKQAAEIWGRVVEQLPTDAYVQHRYAYTLLRAGIEHPLAIAAAQRAIELDSTRADYRITAASLHLAEGHDRTALAQLALACELAPDRPDLAGLHAALTERVARLRE
ncbi:MAG: DnaJ domain-containing protein [Labilithrix sp.]|nr:DnaJ domain-containing protein [Labilithrix sp.]MCW5810695.1 DnaJ domain-containing protein [Labilithrix sp.]